MMLIKPDSLPALSDQPWERSRLEWFAGDSGDPAALVEEFLAEHGLPVRNLADCRQVGSGGAAARSGAAGATLFFSAAAADRAIGAPAGPASPAPAVPDVVAVVWEPARCRPGTTPGPAPGGWRLGPWRPSWTPSRHAAAVTEVQEAIGRGDVYQVNLVGHASAEYQGDPMPALRRVTALPGARHARLLRGAGWAVACASPETLLTVAGGRMETRPIKGTRPATPAGRAQLLDSAKERAEHIMIVDLARNDLARVGGSGWVGSGSGTVRVDELYAVRRWCDLWQAESVVSAGLGYAGPGAGTGLAELLRAVCPGGSVTGAPKRAALELIAAIEPVGRGASMGALGWVGPDRIDLGLTIRTVAVDADRVHVWAGGGITWGSDPASEVAEADAKAAPLRAALAGR
jgi:para-aminobenzoate synthetase component 1